MQSNLSSPFVEKLPLAEDPRTSTVSDSILVTPQPKSLAEGFLSPVQLLEKHPEIVAASEPSSSLLTEPFFPPEAGPSRVPGGELARLREEFDQAEKARIAKLESRRPDYLKRRRLDPVVLDGMENEGVGILTSPEKGRRIQLIDFQTTSAESFEESLMTHGYGTYGEPRTPQRRVASSDTQNPDGLTWIPYNTPAAKPTATPPPRTEDSPLSEKEVKKRKRLDAFKNPSTRPACQLYAVEVEGKGRVLLNVPAEEADEVIGTPARKRALGKKKKAAADKKAKGVLRRAEPVNTVLTPNWLDEYQPWALRNKDLVEKESAETAERMKHIENYFSRNSDSEEEDEGNDRENDEELLPSSMWGQELQDPPVATRRGRGKAVPLQPDPIRPRTPPLRPMQSALEERSKALYFPSDPADARAALLSKRSVRLLAHKHTRQSRPYGNRIKRRTDGHLSCVCGLDEEDERPSVQCDKCYNWCHLECIGAKDPSDLGHEDDPWYCPRCRPREASPMMSFPSQADPYRQPTFAPTDDRPVLTSGRADVALFSSSPQTSPHTAYWGSTRLRSPLRPSRSEHSRIPSWEDPFHIGPSTPYHSARNVKIFTPGVAKFGEFENDDFDSMHPYPTTPSRTLSSPGVGKLGMPFTTPKNNLENGGWAARAGTVFATPRNPINRHPIFGSQDEGSVGTVMARNSFYNTDDTPIRRAPVHGRSLLESPLVPRPGSNQTMSSLMAFEGSPIERRRDPAVNDGPP
ncbi:hypothetical protein SCHPADRAFT_693309 [Schizopora paradoxa]|uniref:PHD-type domain-containing protein n=1 Tax=Schizopora paradoxa TaxID=27342 RepID=A0A0H2R9Z0_9AGAM|nr:hypothetical protein SCHPADRAFT_693309 [Schizopora paradoxa]